MMITPPPSARETRAARSSTGKSPGGVRTGPIGAVLSYAASNPSRVIRRMPHLRPSPRRQVGEVGLSLSLAVPLSRYLRPSFTLSLSSSLFPSFIPSWRPLSPSLFPSLLLCRLPRVMPPASLPRATTRASTPLDSPRRKASSHLSHSKNYRICVSLPAIFPMSSGMLKRESRHLITQRYYRAHIQTVVISPLYFRYTRVHFQVVSRILSNNL